MSKLVLTEVAITKAIHKIRENPDGRQSKAYVFRTDKPIEIRISKNKTAHTMETYLEDKSNALVTEILTQANETDALYDNSSVYIFLRDNEAKVAVVDN